MLLIANDLPINLDVLDADNGVLASLSVRLRHLDGEWATIVLEPKQRATCLHWGSRVRFWIGDGLHGYEVIGSIVAHELQRASSRTSTTAPSPQEALVRLWECRQVDQRRQTPRRVARFPVEFRILKANTPDNASTSPQAEPSSPKWHPAHCLDIGAGGMRLRTDRLAVTPKHLEVRFALPPVAETDPAAETASHHFRLLGRVLRTEPSEKSEHSLEIAIKFERLSVEDGLALTDYLAG